MVVTFSMMVARFPEQTNPLSNDSLSHYICTSSMRSLYKQNSVKDYNETSNVLVKGLDC